MIPFIDLQAQRLRLGGKIEAAVQEAVVGGAWVMGPQVRQFEADLAAFGQAKHALGCANGTDALQIALMALGIGPGDEVITPGFSYIAAAEAVAVLGANGSGKSTLLRVLAGLYEPGKGRILLDGVDIDQLHPRDLRRNAVK